MKESFWNALHLVQHKQSESSTQHFSNSHSKNSITYEMKTAHSNVSVSSVYHFFLFSAPFTTLCCHFWHFPHIHFQHFIYSSIQKNVYSHYCEFIIDVVDTNICIKITCILWEILYFILRTECPPYLKHFHFIFGEWIRNVIRVTPFHLFTSTICFARSWLTLPTPFVMDGRLIL